MGVSSSPRRNIGSIPDIAAQDVVLNPVPAGPPTGSTGWNNRRDPAVAQVCKTESALAPDAGDKTPHLGEAGPETALAKLIDPSCPRVQHLSFEPGGVTLKNADLVNAWIQSITDVGEVGTDFSDEAKAINITSDAVLVAVGAHSLLGIPIPDALAGAVLPTTLLLGALKLSQPDDMKCHELTDYDMGLVGLLRILYLYGPPTPGSGPSVSLITKGTLDYAIKKLLTQTGGVGEWRDHPHLCGIPLPLPETENHILMTESSRYLSNQLIRAQLNPLKIPAIDAATKNRYVNDTNGMKSKLLEKLASFLSNDFHEYNARPYTRMTAKALENLHDFSEHREVRRGANIVLDYISAKFATSSASSGRSVPFRRRTEYENTLIRR